MTQKPRSKDAINDVETRSKDAIIDVEARSKGATNDVETRSKDARSLNSSKDIPFSTYPKCTQTNICNMSTDQF